MPTLNHIVELLQEYRYFLLLPIAIVEGPIITIIAGFLSSVGTMNIFVAYMMVVAGDLIGDSFLFWLGSRSTKNGIPKWLNILGINEQREAILAKKFHEHPKKIFSIGKVTHGGGSSVLFAAGMVKFPFQDFLIYNIILTLIKSAALILIGYYFGKAYIHIKDYLDYGAIIFGVALVGGYYYFLRYTRTE